MHYDLIVIGMGLSGLMAAKTAADSGAKTLVIGKGTGGLCLFSNTVDLLGIPPEETEVKAGLARWITAHPEHPYSKAGWQGIEEALSSFTSLFPPPYSFQTGGEENFFRPTGVGTLRPTYLVPATMVAGNSFKDGKVLIVGFKGFKDFHAAYVADRLKCRGVVLSLAEIPQREITASAIARLMEKVAFQERIGEEIKKQLKGETRVGLPALLGLRDPIRVKKGLEEIIGAETFEISTLPPSIPGMRIFNRLKAWLSERGVTFLQGHPVSGANLEAKRCEGVEVFHPPVTNSYRADRYIVATGRFVGGGLEADDEKISEPIFNLPVAQPESREAWFKKSFFDSHPIHQAGIRTDSSFQPIDERGNRVLENVWVAGTILAGHHCIEEKSREGIEITTGYWAAKNAMEK